MPKMSSIFLLNFLFFSAELHPAPDFGRHTLIKPRIYHGREKRQISTTREEVRNLNSFGPNEVV